jgi:uncharacterized coiled-coil DUF342 family protein
MNNHLKIADLDEKGKATITELEQAIDAHIMAFQPSVKIKQLSPELIKRIQEIEQQLGVTLLVYDQI